MNVIWSSLTLALESPPDFGLAVFFDPDNLPLKDLGMEGTPWFMVGNDLGVEGIW